MATLTTLIFNQTPEDLAKGVHNFTSDSTCTVTVVLTTNGNAPVVGNTVLANLTTVSTTNLSSRVVTGVTAEQTSGSLLLTGNNLTLTSTGGVTGPFRWVAYYNDDPTSPADPLICYGDLGSDITLADGDSLVLNHSNGIIQIAKV